MVVVTVYVLMLDGGYDGDSLLGVYASDDEATAAGWEWMKEQAGSVASGVTGTYVHCVEVGAAAKDYLEERRCMADRIISTWDKSPLWGATFTADEVNSADFGMVRFVRERSRQLARDRDAYARRLLEDRLPRPLHFLLDRPKALRRVLRFVPRWRPTMTVVDLRQWEGEPRSPMTAHSARTLGQAWMAEMRAAGKPFSERGLIFTYADPSGLPAEVYL